MSWQISTQLSNQQPLADILVPCALIINSAAIFYCLPQPHRL